MLKLLKIKNIALVHGVELELGPGLTLLTGETGAGKSILIDSLGLLLGARASVDLIRTGEELAVVEAIVEGPRDRERRPRARRGAARAGPVRGPHPRPARAAGAPRSPDPPRPGGPS